MFKYQTIRVVMGDIRPISYALVDSNGQALTLPATPVIEMDITNLQTGELVNTITCTVDPATPNYVVVPMEDVAAAKSMNTVLFRVSDLLGATIHTVPVQAEQGLWVM